MNEWLRALKPQITISKHMGEAECLVNLIDLKPNRKPAIFAGLYLNLLQVEVILKYIILLKIKYQIISLKQNNSCPLPLPLPPTENNASKIRNKKE